MRRFYAATLLCLAQCTCGVPGVATDVYSCTTDADCVSTMACIGQRCRLKGADPCPVLDCRDPGCEGQTCAGFGQVCREGTCGCSGNGGTPQSPEASCGDGFDNDCNSFTDCADTACDAKACAGGGTCMNRTCRCPGAGGSPQAVETLCDDTLDNDCDGLADCADPSCANVSCGAMGRVCVADAGSGACACGGNGGAVELAEALCADNFDNDCDGQRDCADSTCSGQACGANGLFCVGTACTCSGNGGPSEPGGESSCNDSHDNDCDGITDCADVSCDGGSCGSGCTCQRGAKAESACGDTMDNDGDQANDCADSDCEGVACGMFGIRCDLGTCRCVVDGGTAQPSETTCNDGKDNDCDGLTDCGEAACDGLACGSNGRTCIAGNCTCLADGGVSEPTEVSCNDGRDNDCDGIVDCADSDCNGASCGTGCVCSGSTKTETLCSDGMDNDGDGSADCVDANCSHKACNTASATSVCCGTVCANLAVDGNCGGCGVNCSQGCAAVGRCTCNGNGQCPLGQSCSPNNQCVCSAVNECSSGQSCTSGTCKYP